MAVNYCRICFITSAPGAGGSQCFQLFLERCLDGGEKPGVGESLTKERREGGDIFDSWVLEREREGRDACYE
jgi:hypothetical protein